MRRIAALSVEMRSRSAAFSCLSSSGPFIRPSSVHTSLARRAAGFESVCRTWCVGPDWDPFQGLRRDAPAPTTAAHDASGEGIYPKVHDNAT